MTCRSHDRNRGPRRALPLCAAAALVIALAPAAHAADWPGESPLRGTYQPPAAAGSAGVRWDGVVFGGHFGMSNMNVDYSHATQPLVGQIITNSTVSTEAKPQDWIMMPN